MKTLLFLSLCCFTTVLSAQELRVMSYNIRYNNPNDGENAWPNRKDYLIKQILFTAPDILGTQEVLKEQLDELQAGLTNYTYVGVGRDDGKSQGEFSALFYRKDRFKALQSGTFWLSPTPDQPSKGWDAALNRVCSYALFKGKKGKFWVFNTHFDHRGEQARIESVRVILEQIQRLNTKALPVIVMGDLNLTPDKEAIQYLKQQLNDAYEASTLPPFGPAGTFNGFSWESEIENRIDYIFVSPGIQVLKLATLTDSKDKKYPSDHFPVVADINLN